MGELSNHDEQETPASSPALNDDSVIVDTSSNTQAEQHGEIRAEPLSSDLLQGTTRNIHTRTVGNVRWFGLASICLLMTAEYYSIDISAALHQDLKDYLSTFELRFNLLYTVYSIPNVLLPLLGGFVVDRWGPTRCMIGYSLCLWLGQALFAAGLERKSWTVMLLGRAVFGIGGESICVANSTLLSEWFDPSERAFAFGTLLAISRLGSVLNNVVSPKVAHAFTTPWALWLGVLLNTGGVAAACFVKYLDSSYTKQTESASDLPPPAVETTGDLTEPLLTDDSALDEFLEMETSTESRMSVEERAGIHIELGRDNPPQASSSQSVSIADISRLGPTFWLLCICCMVVYGCIMPFNNVASGILLERNFFQSPPEDCVLEFPRQCTSGSLLSNYSNPSLDGKGHSCPGKGFAPVLPTLPLLNISSTDYNPEVDTKVACDKSFWANECTQDYCNALHAATETAGRGMSIPYAVSAILSPPIGGLVDRVGRRATLACGTSMTLMAVHLILAYAKSSTLPLWLPLLGQGVAYALFSAVIWPSVAMVVEKKMTGTAYGIILSMQNTGLALFPLLVATIYKHSNQKYLPNVELLFVCCAAVGSIAGMLLFILDRRNGKKLNSVGAQE